MKKYPNIFAKGLAPNWSEEFLGIKKVKNTVPWTYIIGTFYEKEFQKINQTSLELEK